MSKSKSSKKKKSDEEVLVEKLTGEIDSLKEEIKGLRKKGEDTPGPEYFKANGGTLESGGAPSDRIRLGRGHIKSIEALAWSNLDPDFVVTVGLDGRCLVWHAPSANKVGVTKLKSQWVQTCAFRSFSGGNSGIVATGGMDNICTVYSLGAEDMKLINELKGHEAFVSACGFTSDSTILTAASDAKTILWDAQKNIQTSVWNFSCGCPSLAIPKQADSFLVGRTDGVVTLCDIRSAKQVSDYYCHSDSLSDLAYFPNGSAFASACDDLSLHLYDLRSGDNVLQRYASTKTEGELTSIDFSVSGRYLFAAYDDMIRVWDTVKATVSFELVTDCKTSCLAINCDGTALASGGADSDGRIWCVA